MLAQIRKLITSRETPEPRSNTGGAPLVSFVVIVYDMPQQAENTLHSLSAKFQRGASEAVVNEDLLGCRENVLAATVGRHRT